MHEGRNALTCKGSKHPERRHAVRQHDDWSLRLPLRHAESIALQAMYSRASAGESRGASRYRSLYGNRNP